MTKRRLASFALAASLIFGGVGSLALAGTASAKTHHKAKPKKPKLPSPHIGQVAKDGNFAFTVTGVQCGLTTLGTAPISSTAPAGTQWCLATMNVKDDKNGAGTFGASDQKAIDGHGRQLSPDAGSVIYLPNDDQAIFATVNPGVSISVVIPFQLPIGGKITKLELHDSPFSGGVTVYNVG
jgi:hypothetical protein